MYVCSLHEKQCPCRLCSIARDSDLEVRSSGDCFDIQFLPLSTAALQSSGPLGSPSLLVSCPPEHQSRKERWAAVSYLDKEKVFPRIDNAKTSTSRETTRSPARQFAARSLLVSCPPGTMVSSYRRSSRSLLDANSSGCLFGKAAHSPGFVPVWCLPEQQSLESDEPPDSLLPLLRRFFGAPGSHMHTLSVSHPTGVHQRHFFLLVTRKVNCSRNLKKVTANISSTFCMLQGSTNSVCGLSTSSALVLHVHLRRHGGPRVNRSRSAAPGNACGR